jgi:hypothetical protein
MPILADAALVGGTALALRHDHRKSVDIDLFFNQKPDFEKIIAEFENQFNRRFHTDSKATKVGIFCFIDNIKVDIVYFPFELLRPIEYIENIPLYSDADIGAMKIKAIMQRAKKKDFWDIFELLQKYSIENLITWYFDKFPNHNILLTIPTILTYFDEAENSEEPISLKGQNWEEIKSFLRKQVRDYLA